MTRKKIKIQKSKNHESIKVKKDTGKNLVVLPIEQKAIDEMKEAYGFTASGYFTPRDIIGGARDPFNRYVYLDPKDPSLYTLAHEGGHAQDKNILYDPYQRERRILSRRGQHTRKPPSSYEEFIKGDGRGAMDVFKDELVAEKYARDYFQDKNLQKPSEAMALNYEIAKGDPFPYDKYKKLVQYLVGEKEADKGAWRFIYNTVIDPELLAYMELDKDDRIAITQ